VDYGRDLNARPRENEQEATGNDHTGRGVEPAGSDAVQGPDERGWPTDPRDIVRLPPADRARIVREAAAAAPFYQPGAPGMAWADEFVDDPILDADASY